MSNLQTSLMSPKSGFRVRIAIAAVLIIAASAGSEPAGDRRQPVNPGDSVPTDRAERLEVGPASGSRSNVEEILIIGEAIAILEATATDSAISFDAEEITARGFTDVADIAAYTPNLEIKAPFGVANPTLFIRGVGLNDYLSNAQSSVAVYNDGVYMQSPTGQLFTLFDSAGIEVLRGPQGSLNGRNATAGAILVSSRKPSGEFGGFSRTTYGRFNRFEQEGAVEFPLLKDLLSARLSGRVIRRDGITKNRCARPDASFDRTLPAPNQENVSFRACTDEADPTTRGLTKDLNDEDTWAARSLIDLDLGNAGFLLNIHGGRSNPHAAVFQHVGRNLLANANPRPGFVNSQRYLDTDLDARSLDPTDGDPYEGDYNRTGRDRVEVFGTNLTANFEFEEWSLESVTAFQGNERDAETDADSSPNIVAELDFQNESRQVSQSFRADWSSATLPWSATSGAIVLYEDLEARNRFRTALLFPDTPPRAQVTGRTQNLDQTTLSWGIYTQLAWDFSETVKLGGGIRYNWDRKDFDLLTCRFDTPFRRPGSEVVNCSDRFRQEGSVSETWSAVTGDVQLTYSPSEEIQLYLKYVRGWKPGQFNGATFSSQIAGALPEGDPLIFDAFDPVDPETNDSVEAGFKAALWDQRLHLSGAGFVYRYEDLQVFRLRNESGSPPINELINAERAQVAGVELEAELELIDGLVINGAFGWLHSQYLEFSQRTRRQIPGQLFPPRFASGVQDFSGNRLIASPEFNVAASARYTLETDRYGTLTPRVDFTWRSEVFFDPNEGRGYFDRDGEFLPQGTLADDALPLLNLRIGYSTPSGGVEVAGWMRNVTDETYKVDAFDLSDGFQSVFFVIGEPRSYGVDFTVRF